VPRALVLALHGGGMTADYFHGRAHPDLSLLDLGARLGFAVLALDRPGYGASQAALPDGQTLTEQTDSIYAALDAYAKEHDLGAGIFVVGHSYGLKVALHLAADPRGERLLGLDGSGVIAQYEPSLDPGNPPPVADDRSPRTLFWGHEGLYPPGTFTRGNRPSAAVPLAEQQQSPSWPQILPGIAPRVRVPYRFTVAEHEVWWLHDDAALAEYRALFTATPRMIVRRQPSAGHNISLGWSARPYHLGALAFAEECIQRAIRTPDPRESQR
jgi:pimeloyl-ACP methyl ester carboxylesterase